jgi:hypothetical protein
LENESTRLLFQNRHLEKINENSIEMVDQTWIKIRINIINTVTEAVEYEPQEGEYEEK